MHFNTPSRKLGLPTRSSCFVVEDDPVVPIDEIVVVATALLRSQASQYVSSSWSSFANSMAFFWSMWLIERSSHSLRSSARSLLTVDWSIPSCSAISVW